MAVFQQKTGISPLNPWGQMAGAQVACGWLSSGCGGLLPQWGLPALLRPLSLPVSEGTQGLSPQGPLGLAVWATRSRGSQAPHSPSGAVGTQAQTAASRGQRPCLSALPSRLCCPQAGGFGDARWHTCPGQAGLPRPGAQCWWQVSWGAGPPSHDCRRERAPSTSPGGVLGSGLRVPKQQSPVSFPSLGVRWGRAPGKAKRGRAQN